VQTTVLIVDDHEDYRRSAAALLESEGFAVIGSVGDGAEAIAKRDLSGAALAALVA
jgi:CheY-like chemotaxis protein